uniref:Cytoplasmic tRNA 2-thiolation protein 2 n=1 Tax=Ascaris suum TaxID=6253 RepID=F1LA40_ASCSU
MSESIKRRKCVKCSEMGTLTGLDPTNAIYCKHCFINMVKHKFSSMIGKKRLYKDGEKRETLIVFEGDSPSALLISLVAQGLKADVHKRLTLIPTVLVLLTVTHEETINSIKHQIASFRETINARWIFAHISAIFCSIDEFGECDSIGNAESIAKWKRLMNGMSF